MFKAIRGVKSWNGSKASIIISPLIEGLFRGVNNDFLKQLLDLPSSEACSEAGGVNVVWEKVLPALVLKCSVRWGDSTFEASRVFEVRKSNRRKRNSRVSPLLHCFHQHGLVQQLILPWLNFFLPFFPHFLAVQWLMSLCGFYLIGAHLFPSLFNLFWFSSSFCDLLLFFICLKGEKYPKSLS